MNWVFAVLIVFGLPAFWFSEIATFQPFCLYLERHVFDSFREVYSPDVHFRDSAVEQRFPGPFIDTLDIEPADELDFCCLPVCGHDDAGFVFRVSGVEAVFAEDDFLNLDVREIRPVGGGCDFIIFIEQPSEGFYIFNKLKHVAFPFLFCIL